ncbi:hydroxymethylbilane synthase [Pseudogracilibacillus sp. SE30717A]|uniref:hydroxymethylbilane synthase n=1 Tax=Pseudogracilibacillus sp. SE30717A TaxID=3098293 RepID=UPI00300DD96E
MRKVIVGTRESTLAVTQTKQIIQKLKDLQVPYEFELKYISTKGDRNQKVSLSKVGGVGIFIQDIEDALRNKEIDFAVHSLKDLPAYLDDEFTIAAIPKREDHRDAYIGRNNIPLGELPEGAIIGTSSARRAAQIKAKYPYLKTQWIRGAVDARIQQLQDGKYDGIILAVAGLKRLGITDVITEYLPANDFTPAAGQGALAIECRNEDEDMIELLTKINDSDSEIAIKTEREFVNLLDDEDKAPIGAYAHLDNGEIVLYTSVASMDGEQILTCTSKGDTIKAVAEYAANKLIEEGAKSMVEAAKEELDKE